MNSKERQSPQKRAVSKTLFSITKLLTWPVVGALLVLLTASCEKIETSAAEDEVVEFQSIPLKYGQLKSVTMTEQYPGWAQLWFQDDAGTISMVRVDWVRHKMMKEHVTIARAER